MSNKHYREQKMLIENFRKWQAEELHEETINEETINEERLDEDILALLTIPPMVLYTLGPWLKLAVHHPKVEAVLSGADTEGSTMFRAMIFGLKGADNAGQWIQDWANNIFAKEDAKGKKTGLITRMKNGILLFTFLMALWSTAGLGTIFLSMAARAVPAITQKISRAKKKLVDTAARIKGEPTPDEKAAAEKAAADEKAAAEEEERKELEELENLEEEQRQTISAAGSVSEVIAMAKEDPEKFMEMYNVSLSEEDLKTIRDDPPADPTDLEQGKSKSKRKSTKVKLPPKKVSPDELAARKQASVARDMASGMGRKRSIGGRVVQGLKDRD
jgi:hypothetical protein